MAKSPDPEYAEAIDAEIAGMRDDEGEPFDHAATAERLARELDERGAGHMDPPDEVYWRDVAVELRRRAIRAV